MVYGQDQRESWWCWAEFLPVWHLTDQEDMGFTVKLVTPKTRIIQVWGAPLGGFGYRTDMVDMQNFYFPRQNI